MNTYSQEPKCPWCGDTGIEQRWPFIQRCRSCKAGTPLLPAELRAESAPRTGETAPAGEAARRSLSEPVEWQTELDRRITEARRKVEFYAKEGNRVSAGCFYERHDELFEFRRWVERTERERLKGNVAISARDKV